MRPLMRLLTLLLAALAGLVPLSVAPTASAAVPSVRINEVESNGGPTDWIELINTGSDPVDLSGWVLRDNQDASAATIPASTTLAPGGLLAIDTDVTTGSTNFGLGGADSARVFLADGTTLVDSYSWTSHATTTYGRCPDGTGDFATTIAGTKAATNSCPAAFDPMSVRLNEVESNGDTVGDWVELVNTSAAP